MKAVLLMCGALGLAAAGLAQAEMCTMSCDHYGSQHDYLCEMTQPEGEQYYFNWTLKNGWHANATGNQNIGFVHAECHAGVGSPTCNGFGVRVQVTKKELVLGPPTQPGTWYSWTYVETPVCTVQRGNM